MYRTFDNYIKNNYHTACNRGCSSCCTQNVTLTTLEGYQVLKSLKKNESTRSLNSLSVPDPSRFRPRFTVNDLASACLNREEPPDEGPGPDLKACLLLQDDLCSIYCDRPFACRSFLSQKACQLNGEAEVSHGLASVIAACQQIIEHMDVNGYYGNIVDIVHFLNLGSNDTNYAGGNRLNAADLSPTKPIPGFLIPPDDAAEVRAYLSRLFHGNINGEPFYKRLVSLCPMPVNSN